MSSRGRDEGKRGGGMLRINGAVERDVGQDVCEECLHV